MRLMLAIVIAAAAAGASAGEIYRWVDKDGRVHYGDRPKTGGEEVEVRTGPTTPNAAEAEKVAAARAAECERLKGQYDTYSQATSLKETDNLGRTREYTPEERQQFVAKIQKQRDEACAPAPATP